MITARTWSCASASCKPHLLGILLLLLLLTLTFQSLWNVHEELYVPMAIQGPVTSNRQPFVAELTKEPPAVAASEVVWSAAADLKETNLSSSSEIPLAAHSGAWNPYIPGWIQRSPLFKPFSVAEVRPYLLPEHVIQGVRTFVFFVGIGRSGTTVLSLLLDAHPNAIIANDYALFMKWPEDPSFHRNRTLFYSAIYCQSKRQAVAHPQTHLHGRDAYLGKYRDHVSVVGDKEAGTATRFFRVNRQLWKRVFAELQKTVNVPIRLIQVVRNPFDAIASFAFMLTPGGNSMKQGQQAWDITSVSGFEEAQANFFANQQAVLDMLQDPALSDVSVHHVHLASLVRSPRQEMARLCDYLGLTCYPAYFKACQNAIHSKLSMTKDLLQWTPDVVDSIEQKMKQFPWLRGYNFTSN